MRKSIMFLVIISLLSMLVLQSCSSTDNKNKPVVSAPKISVLSPSDVKGCKDISQVGQVFIQSIVEGLSTKNYEMYTRDFTPEAKKSFTKDIFDNASDAVNENLGKFLSDSYLGYYDKGGFSILLWKAKYSKSKDDVLFELYVKRLGATYQVAAFVPN